MLYTNDRTTTARKP